MKRFDLSSAFLSATLFLPLAAFAADEASGGVAAQPPLPPSSASAAQSPAPEASLSPDITVRHEITFRTDRNGDGKVDDTERALMRDFLASASRFGEAPGQPRPFMARDPKGSMELQATWLKRADKNEDGKVDDAEMTACSESLRAGLEIAAARGDGFDRNADGKLDDKEWTAAQQHLQRWLNREGNLMTAVDPAMTQARLQAVAGEVARRREQREAAGARLPVQINPTPEEREKRRGEVEAEILRRREVREKQATSPSPGN